MGAQVSPALLHFSVVADINNTVTLGDSTKGKKNNPLMSQVAETITAIWAEGLAEMSYKDYIQKIKLPGNKYDKGIKEQQEEKIANFLNDLDRTQHPAIYEKAVKVYQDLEKQYWDHESKSIKFDMFPSFFHLIDTIKSIGQCSVTFQTFGPDGDKIAEELKKRGWKEPRRATMVSEGALQFEGESEVIKGPEMLRRLQMETTIVQVLFKTWEANHFEAAFGKIVPCAVDGEFDGRQFITLFLDDNLNKKVVKENKSAADKMESADPKAKNIAYPQDIYGRPTHWNAKGIVGLKVNTVKAALNPEYLVKKVEKHLLNRGIVLINAM